jgi:trigger factor
LEDYQKYLNKTSEEMREDMKPGAEREVRTELVLEAVVKAEGIEASAEDVDEEIEKIAEVYSQEKETVKQAFESQGTIPVIEENIRLRKAISFLTENAKPVLVKEETEKEEAK